MKKGDFTKLANDYVKFRPSYNKKVTQMIINSINKNYNNIIAADVGAGTGIFSQCLIDCGVNKITAVMGNCRDTSEVFFQLIN